jgi:histidine triad (HIT) family protein
MTDSLKDCIFCKIVSGEIPSYKVYEDDQYLGFLDIAPVSRGHTLLVPKTHYQWVYQAPNVGEYFQVATNILKILQKQLNPSLIHYMTWGDIPHAHIHIIPRYQDDGFGAPYDKVQKPQISEKEMAKIADSIFSSIK